MTIAVITDRERAARAALEAIAARGETFDAFAKSRHPDDVIECPEHGDPEECDCGNQQCPECGHLQRALGPCLDADCLTAIARTALDELRRAP